MVSAGMVTGAMVIGAMVTGKNGPSTGTRAASVRLTEAKAVSVRLTEARAASGAVIATDWPGLVITVATTIIIVALAVPGAEAAGVAGA